jgi:transcriptional regulator with XRE-family HTH domain
MPAADLINPDASMWHWLAVDLRRYRLAKGVGAAEVAGIMECSRSQVSNYEAMKRQPAEDELKRLDTEWRTNGHFVRIFRYARRNHDPSWYTEHLHYEERARSLRIWEPLKVPGLLQTPEYARVAIETEGSADVDAGVSGRMARQRVLTRPTPPRMLVILDEGVIDRPVGGAEVMREQLRRLLELSALPDVTLRIAPRRMGYHLGLAGAFKIMNCVPEGDIAYTEATEGGRLVLDGGDVQRFVVRFDEIGADAMSRSESRGMIERVVETMT